MKKHSKKLAGLLLIILIFTVTTCMKPVLAEESVYNNQNIIIELVVDASSSLMATDPNNNRYTAIDVFLHTLREKGTYAGAVVFSSKIKADSGLSKMESEESKEELSKMIRGVPIDGGTNTGLALQTAVDNLTKFDNGSEKIILLISDGNTGLSSQEATNDSFALKNVAIDQCIDQCINEKIKVYGICLNGDGLANSSEFEDMTSSTSGAFIVVDSADDLVVALMNLYAQIFNTKYTSDTMTINDGDATLAIDIPSYGIEELNLTINNASRLNEVVLTTPYGLELSPNEFARATSLIDDYYFIKIIDPAAGCWKLTILGEEGTNFDYGFAFNSANTAELETTSEDKSLSLNEEGVLTTGLNSNSDITVELETTSEDNSFSPNGEMYFSAGLYSNGNKLIGNEYYDSYKGTLIVNYLNGNIKTYPMYADGQNGFTASLSFDKEGTYEVSAQLISDEFEIRSKPITISIQNALPVFSAGEKILHIKIAKFLNKAETINIGQYFSDKEDQDLSLSIIASSYEDDDIEGPDGNEIILKNLVDGQLTVMAVDSHGGTVTGIIQIEVNNLMWIINIISITVVMLLIFFNTKGKNGYLTKIISSISVGKVTDDNKSSMLSKNLTIMTIVDDIEKRFRTQFIDSPADEKEVQEQLRKFFDANGYEQGADYERESGKFQFSGREYIPDFVFKGLNTALEVKILKDRSKKNKMIEEMNADCSAYIKEYSNLIFVVYDIGCISNIGAFKRDFEKKGNVKVVVVKH